MYAQIASVCFTTDKIDQCRDFYVRCLGAQVVFDCGWYLDLRLGDDAARVQFMSPRGAGAPLCSPAGLTLNVRLEEVDAEHRRLTALGLDKLTAPEDHPWGDRSFTLTDPNGLTLCLYVETEPSEEYKRFFR